MPFIWNKIISSGTRLSSEPLKEIKNNADIAANTIGIAPWSWTTNLTNLIATNRDSNILYTEMHNAIDYLYNNRTCTLFYSAVLNSNNSTQNTTFNGTVYGTNRVSENTTYCSSQNGAVNLANRLAENTTYCSSQNASVNSSNYTSQNTTYCGPNNSTVYSTNCSTVNSTVYSGNDYAANNNKTTNYTSQNTVQNSSQNITAYTSQNVTVNSTKNGSYSDSRLKILYGSIQNSINKIMNLNSYYYSGNDLGKSLGLIGDEIQIGLIAQEVKEVLPEVVIENFENKNYMALDYSKITVLLIEAIKEQQKQINELNNIVISLKERN